jgi:hypothetical protein
MEVSGQLHAPAALHLDTELLGPTAWKAASRSQSGDDNEDNPVTAGIKVQSSSSYTASHLHQTARGTTRQHTFTELLGLLHDAKSLG